MRDAARKTLAVCVAFLWVHSAQAADFIAQLDIRTVASSNVFLDKSEEWDLVLRPSAELGVDFARYWSLGYTGELNAYTRHADLLSHFHEIYLFLNPAWGDEGENEVVVEASLQTLRNQDDYQELNLLQPALTAKLIMEPRRWLRWKLSASGAYRYFYDDKPSDSLDAWARGEVTFTPQTAELHTGTLGSSVFNGTAYAFSISGYGVEVEPPVQTVGEVLDFFDTSVTDGTLVGDGNGNSANGRRNALRNMIEASDDLFAAGDLDGACHQLTDAYRRTDGDPKPPDFVAGTAAADLADALLLLMDNLGCP